MLSAMVNAGDPCSRAMFRASAHMSRATSWHHRRIRAHLPATRRALPEGHPRHLNPHAAAPRTYPLGAPSRFPPACGVNRNGAGRCQGTRLGWPVGEAQTILSFNATKRASSGGTRAHVSPERPPERCSASSPTAALSTDRRWRPTLASSGSSTSYGHNCAVSSLATPIRAVPSISADRDELDAACGTRLTEPAPQQQR